MFERQTFRRSVSSRKGGFKVSADKRGRTISGISSRYYDRVSNWAGLGEAFRAKVVDEASLKPGESILDCGCGTGRLAFVAKRRVGREGLVRGIDLSRDQLAIAKENAQGEGLDIEFIEGSIDELPFPDDSFDAIFSTLMLHHVPRGVKTAAFGEMRRVLRPGGRIVIVDFGPPKNFWGRLLFSPLMLALMVFSTSRDNAPGRLPELMSGAGLRVTEQSMIKFVVHLIKAE